MRLLICTFLLVCCTKKNKNIVAEMTSTGWYSACSETECAICREDDMDPWEAIDKCLSYLK